MWTAVIVSCNGSSGNTSFTAFPTALLATESYGLRVVWIVRLCTVLVHSCTSKSLLILHFLVTSNAFECRIVCSWMCSGRGPLDHIKSLSLSERSLVVGCHVQLLSQFFQSHCFWFQALHWTIAITIWLIWYNQPLSIYSHQEFGNLYTETQCHGNGVYSIPANKEWERRKEPINSPPSHTQRICKTNNKRPGPWVPNLENWDGRLHDIVQYSPYCVYTHL